MRDYGASWLEVFKHLVVALCFTAVYMFMLFTGIGRPNDAALMLLVVVWCLVVASAVVTHRTKLLYRHRKVAELMDELNLNNDGE